MSKFLSFFPHMYLVSVLVCLCMCVCIGTYVPWCVYVCMCRATYCHGICVCKCVGTHCHGVCMCMFVYRHICVMVCVCMCRHICAMLYVCMCKALLCHCICLCVDIYVPWCVYVCTEAGSLLRPGLVPGIAWHQTHSVIPYKWPRPLAQIEQVGNKIYQNHLFLIMYIPVYLCVDCVHMRVDAQGGLRHQIPCS